MDDKVRTPSVERFLTALGATRNNDERYALFLDVATVRELHEMSQRLEVASLLRDGKPYTYIQEKTGASATTVARVSKCLNYGRGGYAATLDRIEGAAGADSSAQEGQNDDAHDKGLI